MAVLEQEDVALGAVAVLEREERARDTRATEPDDGPPDLPPVFYRDGDDRGDDDDGDDDDDGVRARGPWSRRVFTIAGIVVLLSMIVSPVAADLLAARPIPVSPPTSGAGR